MTPESAARVLRCIGATAGEWRDEVRALLDCSAAEADRQRRECSPDALRALSWLAGRALEGARAVGIDPGRNGFLVASRGLVWVASWRLASLYQDEAPDGPAARRAHNAALDRGELPKGSRKRDPSKGTPPRWRLDPVALRFIADVVLGAGLDVYIEDAQFRPSVQAVPLVSGLIEALKAGANRAGQIAVVRSHLARGESAKAAATTASNHRALVQAFQAPPHRIVEPSAWQAGWSDERTYPQFPRGSRWHLADGVARRALASDKTAIKAVKVRSLKAAKDHGLDTTQDGEADAFGVSTIPHRSLAHAARVD